MKFKQVVNIDTALRIYYSFNEIGNKELVKLFGPTSSRTLTRYKDAVKAVQFERGVKTSGQYTINTELAYEVFGIDVARLERNRKKLISLGLCG